MNGFERRIGKLEKQTGAGEPIELVIHTGVPRIGDDEGVVSCGSHLALARARS
jgi:hypothetical protein